MMEYCFTAETMPMGMAMVHVNSMVRAPRSAVIPRRAFKSSVTGRLYSRESPRSQTRIPENHFQYCTTTDRSKPYLRFRCSISE